MRRLTVVAHTSGEVQIQDPFPAEGRFVVDVPPGALKSFYITDAQYDHIRPQLDLLLDAGLIISLFVDETEDARTESIVHHSVILPTVVGHRRYHIPIGSWFVEGSPTTLEINKGSGWIEQSYSVDYSHLQRYTPPPTVADLCLGWELTSPPPAGWLMRFGWEERRMGLAVETVIPILVDASGEPDYSVLWYQPISGVAPNAVQVPEIPGLGVEFWRQTSRTGGLRGDVLRRSGKRWVPYYRHTVGDFVARYEEFAWGGTQKMRQYRVRYYDPITGARGPLSADIFAVGGMFENRVRTDGVIHAPYAVWMKR